MTAADKPRDRAHAFVPSTRPGYEHTCSVSGCGALEHDEEHAGGEGIDKPRADLVALFDAFARLPEGHAMLSLFGGEHEPALRAWAAEHRRSVREQPLHNATDGRWMHLEVRVTGGWINVHGDRIEEPAAPADQQVLARVQAALDGERRDEDGNRIMDHSEIEAREGMNDERSVP